MREKQYLCAVKTNEIMCTKGGKKFVMSMVVAAMCLLVYGCAQSPGVDPNGGAGTNGFPNRLVVANLSDDQREVLWSDTITPPNNPFAPAADDSMVTVVGAIGLDEVPRSGSDELYCCVNTSNDNRYFLTSKQPFTEGGVERFTLWRYDAEMLQPGYGGSPDTICVGDTIAVTGYAYTMVYARAVVLDVRFVQKYSSSERGDTGEE